MPRTHANVFQKEESRAEGMEESGDPGEPPVPGTAFPDRGEAGPLEPPVPPDWVRTRRRLRGREERGG